MPQSLRRLAWFVAIWLASGIFIVREGEQAVAKGKGEGVDHRSGVVFKGHHVRALPPAS